MIKCYTLLGWVLLTLCPLLGRTQVTVQWQKWPSALQLYPRDDQNKAEVPIAGLLQSTAYSHASVLVFKNGVRWKYQRTAVEKTGNQSRFAFNTSIEAGLNTYKFAVYAINNTDSVLVDSRDNIVCGDVFLFNGQSNLTGYYPTDYFYRNDFLRTFGNSASDQLDSAWHISNVQEGQVGRIATEFQRLILENYGMPTCVINGAVGGTSIKSHIFRNLANPADPGTLYGRLLYWARKAGVVDQVKAFVWRQGENEAGGGSAVGYEEDIRLLYTNWQTDFPTIQKYYIAQVNLLPDVNQRAAELRDFQRRTPQIFPKTDAIATVGLPSYDGVHYGPPGQVQFAYELFRMVARDFYQEKDTEGVSSPAIQKVYYRTKAQDEVVLEFEPGARMVWKQDTVVDGQTRDIRDYIYFDYAHVQQERVIASGQADGNRVILKLSKPIAAKTITYLPDRSEKPFGGPFLKNRRGMRAFTFHNVAIGAAPTDPEPPLNVYEGNLESVSCASIQGWAYNKGYPDKPVTVELLANNLVIDSLKADDPREGAGNRGFNFAFPASLKNGQNQVIAVQVKGTDYVLPGSPKNLTCAKPEPPILSTPPLETLSVTVYPNPSQGRLFVRVLIPVLQAATFQLVDQTGRLIWHKTVPGTGKLHEELIDIPVTSTQAILVSVQVGERRAVRKVLLSR
ncbi:sialate O-acetylesterase [Larkinella sp. VNQ87]|uniref:sialate O-acetylesterase n=1 Tax=Larkinella sp. VNQ87 TaxID=3400921 RepID=UPI003C0C9714